MITKPRVMKVTRDGRAELRPVASVEMIHRWEGPDLLGTCEPELRDGEMALHTYGGETIIVRGKLDSDG